MLSFSIVEDLDGLETRRVHFVMRGVADAMHPLVLEVVEPTFRLPWSSYLPIAPVCRPSPLFIFTGRLLTGPDRGAEKYS
jgi:hypothetical protein